MVNDNSTYEFIRFKNGRFVGENGKTVYQAQDLDAFICFSLSDEEKILFQEETKPKNPTFISYTAAMQIADCLAKLLKLDDKLLSVVNEKGRLSCFLLGKYLGSLLSLEIPKDIVQMITTTLVALEIKEASLVSVAFFNTEITQKRQKALEQAKNEEESKSCCPIM